MLIRFLPESLSFLCIVASAQPDMTVKTFDASILAELDRKEESKQFARSQPQHEYHSESELS